MTFEGELLVSASERARHVSNAIAWYADRLRSDDEFRQTFAAFVGAATEAAVADAKTATQIRRQIHFVAVGKSAGVSRLAVDMFVSVGILARFLHPGEAFHGDLGSVCEHDTVVCISNGGATAEILHLLPKLRERSCRIFAITSRPDSPLAKASDYFLPLPNVDECCPLQQAPITSPVTTLAICQLLVAASIEHRAYNVDNYARNHPGGSIGKRIYLRVSDVMIKGDALPLAPRNATFPECVSLLTRYAKSVLLVEEQGKLAGIISERDIRVAMERDGRQVFERIASELMNPKPLTIEGDLLALDALKIMKERKTPLNFLPVVDNAGNIAGLIRLHDLVTAGIGLV